MQKRVFVKTRLLNGANLLRKAAVIQELPGGNLRVMVDGQLTATTIAASDTVQHQEFGRQQSGGRGELPVRCYPTASGAIANRV